MVEQSIALIHYHIIRPFPIIISDFALLVSAASLTAAQLQVLHTAAKCLDIVHSGKLQISRKMLH